MLAVANKGKVCMMAKEMKKQSDAGDVDVEELAAEVHVAELLARRAEARFRLIEAERKLKEEYKNRRASRAAGGKN
jgi:hypothetical protein